MKIFEKEELNLRLKNLQLDPFDKQDDFTELLCDLAKMAGREFPAKEIVEIVFGLLCAYCREKPNIYQRLAHLITQFSKIFLAITGQELPTEAYNALCFCQADLLKKITVSPLAKIPLLPPPL